MTDRAAGWRVAALVGAAVALWVGAGVWLPATPVNQVTGDEPHYLLSALSLGEDHDLDVADERREGRYRSFYSTELPVQEKLQPDGSRISPHDPLLPAVLALPTTLGGWMAAKLTLAAAAGSLAAVMWWTARHRLGVSARTTTLAVAAFAGSPPLAVYATQVYPEIVAALAVALGLAALTGPLRTGGIVALSVVAVALPWLSVKYAPVAVVLAAAASVTLVRRGDMRSAFVLGAALACAGVAFVIAHLAWYDGVTPYAVGLHFRAGELSVVGSSPDYLGRSTRLVGLVLDRDFGLAAWQPAYLLAAPAGAALLRARPPGWVVLVAPWAVGWLSATFVALTMAGWWFPGRQVVVVLPAIVLVVAWWADRCAPARLALGVFAAVGALVFAALVLEGRAGRLGSVVGFESALLFEPWRALLPDYRRGAFGDWTRHAVWLAALGGASVVAARPILAARFGIARRARCGVAIDSPAAARGRGVTGVQGAGP